MDARIAIVALAAILGLAAAITVTDPPPGATTESPFVPGVFIAVDTLKNLQEAAKATESHRETPTMVTNKDLETTTPITNEKPIQGFQQEQPSTQPNQQPYVVDQQAIYPIQQGYQQNQPMVYSNQPYTNQPALLLINQQPGYNQQQGYNQQPTYNQQNGIGPQGYVLNNPSYQQQPYLVNEQPVYQNYPNQQQPYQNYQNQQPPFQNYPNQQQPYQNYPNQQQPYQNYPNQGVMFQQPPHNQQPVMLGQQSNGALFVPNGQYPQQNIGNPNMMGQQGLMNNGNGGYYQNPQAQGGLYAMIPVGQNNMQNPNGNNNQYFVPMQQQVPNVNTKDTA